MIETNLKEVAYTPIAHRVSLVLLLIRLSIFLTMIVWVIDKLVRPERGAAALQAFYSLGGIANELIFGLGVIQLVIMLGFVAGYYKKITYGLVLLMHTASTLVSFPKYLSPLTDANILSYAAWPMLAACFGLYYLRDLDTRGTVNG